MYAFWQKYVTLGPFADRWLDAYDIRTTIGPLHLDARDVVAKGDREAARAFYRERMAMEKAERADQLIQHGILTRILGPKELLDKP